MGDERLRQNLPLRCRRSERDELLGDMKSDVIGIPFTQQTPQRRVVSCQESALELCFTERHLIDDSQRDFVGSITGKSKSKILRKVAREFVDELFRRYFCAQFYRGIRGMKYSQATQRVLR